jgi:L-xylulokinase
MSGQYLLGLDNGGTFVKAGLYRVSGEAAAFASAEIPAMLDRGGIVERGMDALWAANCRVVREVIAKAGVKPADIACVSVAGHGNGLYLVDEALQPVMNGIYSTDTRAKDYVERFRQSGALERIFPKVMQSLYPGQLPPLLAWLSDNSPELIERAKWALGCNDYIRLKLTDEAFAEITNTSAACVLDQNKRDYDAAILDEMGIGHCRRLLAPLKQSCEVCGNVTVAAAAQTGLAEGTPVAGGMIDLTSCAIATGLTDSSRLCVIAGTWGINEFIWDRALVSPEILLTSVYCLDGYYLVTDGSMTSASNLEWYVRECFPTRDGENAYKQADALVETVGPEESAVIFLPFLNGTNIDADAKGGFLGLAGWHTKAHLLRAVFEGVVFAHRTHIERLLSLRDRPEAVRMAGGASRSGVWAQMFADALALPVEVSDHAELGTQGMAMCAGVAAGCFPSLREASQVFSKVSRVLQPGREKKDIYDEKYRRYCRVVDCLKPVWRDEGI